MNHTSTKRIRRSESDQSKELHVETDSHIFRDVTNHAPVDNLQDAQSFAVTQPPPAGPSEHLNQAALLAELAGLGIADPPPLFRKLYASSAPRLDQILPSDCAFHLGPLTRKTYFGEPIDPTHASTGDVAFQGLRFHVLKAERSEVDRPVEAGNALALQSSQSSFHLAASSLPPVLDALLLQSGFALVHVFRQDDKGELSYSGCLSSTTQPLVNIGVNRQMTLSSAYQNRKLNSRNYLWSSKTGKSSRQNKDRPQPLVLRRTAGSDGSISQTFRLLVSLHSTYNGTVLLDANLKPCISLTNPFLWITPREQQTLNQVLGSRSPVAEPEEAIWVPDERPELRFRTDDSTWSMPELFRLVAEMQDSEFGHLIHTRLQHRSDRCALIGLQPPQPPADQPKLVTLESLRPLPDAPAQSHDRWRRSIQAVAHFIGSLHANPAVYNGEMSLLHCENFDGVLGRKKDIEVAGLTEAKAWLQERMECGEIPSKPSIMQTVMRQEQLASIVKQEEFRSVQVVSLRDTFPGIILVEESAPSKVRYLSTHDIDRATHLEDRMLLLARFYHTANIKANDCERLLFVPYQLGIEGRPLEDLDTASGSSLLPALSPADRRRFYIIRHVQFLEYHLYFILWRNRQGVDRFRKGLLEQEQQLRIQLPEYWDSPDLPNTQNRKTGVMLLKEWEQE